jgi:hypothetical protein
MPVPLFALGYSTLTKVSNSGKETTENVSSSWICLYHKYNAQIPNHSKEIILMQIKGSKNVN